MIGVRHHFYFELIEKSGFTFSSTTFIKPAAVLSDEVGTIPINKVDPSFSDTCVRTIPSSTDEPPFQTK